MNEATVSCDTTVLADGVRLYWQYNCDRIWLTLQNKQQQAFVIDEVPVMYYPYVYRLGFHLIREFKNTLLFRAGCSASGPCRYILIDKNTGKVVKEFGQLLCIDTDTQWDKPYHYPYDFVVDLAENHDFLYVFYIDTKKTLKIPFTEKLSGAIPAYQFKKMTLKGSNLTLTYVLDDNRVNTLKIDLADKKYEKP